MQIHRSSNAQSPSLSAQPDRTAGGKPWLFTRARVCSPHVRKSTALIPHSSFPIPHSGGPFLALTHLGPSTEPDHLRNYAAEAQLAEQREKQQIRKSKSVVNMLMSREYKRYIEG